MAKILQKLNGSKKYIAIISLSIATSLMVLKILMVVIAASATIAEIKAYQVSEIYRVTEMKLDFKSKISYLDIYGCKPSQNNTKNIAVLGAKK